MSWNEKIILLSGIIIHCLGCYFFYHAFLPAKKLKTGIINEYKASPIAAKYTHLIVIVIDAFRADFIFEQGKWSNQMPFLRGLIHTNRTFSFRSKVEPPTVTMPRLKALTTGAVSDFKDMFSNVASAELNTDNIIEQFYLKGKNMLFFGDNTWLKLFPRQFFRSDGTHSFYVSDYSEVDHNVTRHVDVELNKFDWQVMILHYLGLDHIGHLAGPSSPLIGPKLKEMDDIIKRIYNGFSERSAANKEHPLFLITGDHGMSDGGSHGGASFHEVFTPLLFLDRTRGSYFNNEIVNQVDIASTIACLFNLPIPKESIGHPIVPLLALSGVAEVKLIQKEISCHLSFLAKDVSNKALLEDVRDICNGDVRKDAFNLTKLLSDELQSLSPHYNDLNMVFGIIAMALGFSLILLNLYKLSVRRPYLHSCCYGNIQGKCNTRISGLVFHFQTFCIAIIFVSFGSSSYIEEEHFIWYYFLPSFFLLIVIFCRKERLYSILIVFFLRVIQSWNSTGVNWIALPDLKDWFTQDGNERVAAVLTVLLLLISLIFQLSHESKLGKCLYFTCIFCLVIYHGCYMKLLLSKYRSKLLIYSAQLVYLHIILMALLKSFSFMKSFKTVFIPTGLLLLKSDNLAWFLLMVLVEEIFTQKLLSCILANLYLAEWQIFWIFFAFSKFAFFSQGNSNSFSTIDISAGMIGFTEYHIILSNILTFIATYSGQMLWMASYLDYVGSTKSVPVSTHIIVVAAGVYQSLEGLLICVIVFLQRYHLFIWSVFAPRYIYMLVSTSFIMTLLTFETLKNLF